MMVDPLEILIGIGVIIKGIEVLGGFYYNQKIAEMWHRKLFGKGE